VPPARHLRHEQHFEDEAAEFAWITRLGKEIARPIWFLLTDRPTDPRAGGASWPASMPRAPQAPR